MTTNGREIQHTPKVEQHERGNEKAENALFTRIEQPGGGTPGGQFANWNHMDQSSTALRTGNAAIIGALKGGEGAKVPTEHLANASQATDTHIANLGAYMQDLQTRIASATGNDKLAGHQRSKA